jgi:hypothetical protein
MNNRATAWLRSGVKPSQRAFRRERQVAAQEGLRRPPRPTLIAVRPTGSTKRRRARVIEEFIQFDGLRRSWRSSS